MGIFTTAGPWVPDDDTPDPEQRLAELASAARDCRGCELYRHATHTVFGSGSTGAPLMLVGEQPGDREDLDGRPFVGPAGHLLNRVLEEAGIERSDAYVTNVVKHFRWKSTEGTTRRIHQSPGAGHLHACRPWLVTEIAAVRPRVVVALGAVAAKSLFGSSFSLTRQHGRPLAWPQRDDDLAEAAASVETGLATIHPSAILRIHLGEERRDAIAAMVADLRVAARLVATEPV